MASPSCCSTEHASSVASSAELRLAAVLRHLHSEEPHIAHQHGLTSNATRAAVTGHVASLHVLSCSRSFFQLQLQPVQLQPPRPKDPAKDTVDTVDPVDLVDSVHPRYDPAPRCSNTSSTLAPSVRGISHPPASRKDNRVSFGRACRDDVGSPSASSSWPPVLSEPPSPHAPHPRRDSRTLFARVSSGVPNHSCLPPGTRSQPAASSLGAAGGPVRPRTISPPPATKCSQLHKAPVAPVAVACTPCSGPGSGTMCHTCGVPVKGPANCGLSGCNVCVASRCGAPPLCEPKGKCRCLEPCSHVSRLAECSHYHPVMSTTRESCGKQCELHNGAGLPSKSMPASACKVPPPALLSPPPKAPTATGAVDTHHPEVAAAATHHYPEVAVACTALVFPPPPPPAIAFETGQRLVLVIPLPARVGANDFTVQIEKCSTLHVLLREQGLQKTLFRWALPVTRLAIDKASAELRKSVIHITFPKLDRM